MGPDRRPGAAALVAATLLSACSSGASDAVDPTPPLEVAPDPTVSNEPLPLLTLIRPSGWTPEGEDLWVGTAAEPDELAASCATFLGADVTGPAHATRTPYGVSVTFISEDAVLACDSVDHERWCGVGGWGSTEPPFTGLLEAGGALAYCPPYEQIGFLFVPAPEGAAWVISDDGAHPVWTGVATLVHPELPARINAQPEDAGGASTTVTWFDEDGNLLDGPTEVRGYVAG